MYKILYLLFVTDNLPLKKRAKLYDSGAAPLVPDGSGQEQEGQHHQYLLAEDTGDEPFVQCTSDHRRASTQEDRTLHYSMAN